MYCCSNLTRSYSILIAFLCVVRWLTSPPARSEVSVLRLQAYPWYLLENGPRSYTFTSDGQYQRWFLRFTASGAPEQNSLGITLDGTNLPWEATGSEDRMFYTYYHPSGFASGQHIIRFEQRSQPTGNFKRQLCSLTLHEYKAEPEFHFGNSHISAYRTWREGNSLVGYRPSNEQCLMRNMSSPRFCDVCLENMWLQFFRTVSLIDNITLTCADSSAVVVINVIPLAQFRTQSVQFEESYLLRWFHDDQYVPGLDNTYSWTREWSEAVGTWEARLQFTTSQVRHDPSNLLSFLDRVTIPTSAPC